MAQSVIELNVVTREKKVYEDDIKMAVFPSTEGNVGILPKHAPLVATLKAGVIDIKSPKDDFKMSISGGFLHVKPDKITVLAKTAEKEGDIDVERAVAAKNRAEERLAARNKDDIDFARAESAIERAIARLRAKGQEQ